jgi:hypothetical protein
MDSPDARHLPEVKISLEQLDHPILQNL